MTEIITYRLSETGRWGYEFYDESRTVDVHIKRIREKIEKPDGSQSWAIRTIWSKGYKFETK